MCEGRMTGALTGTILKQQQARSCSLAWFSAGTDRRSCGTGREAAFTWGVVADHANILSALSHDSTRNLAASPISQHPIPLGFLRRANNSNFRWCGLHASLSSLPEALLSCLAMCWIRGASSELLIHYSRNPTSACAVGETSEASLRLPPDRPMHAPPLAWRQRTARHALAGRTKGRRPILFRVEFLCGVSPTGAISLIGLLPDPC